MAKRRRGHDRLMGWVAALALFVGATGFVGAGATSASTVRHGSAAKTSFQITGAGKGALRAGPFAGCLNNLVKTNGLTDVNDLVGSISGFSEGVQSWSLLITEKKTGKFEISGALTAEPRVELQPSPKNLAQESMILPKDTFYAKSGTVTVAAETGSISASLATMNGATIEISGSWSCKS
ncbi:MAG TPA: hypothetical protein VED84_06585 [Acidimicrobiales bacterium]|nr:hypothetical protein [Acidimicrobiales bacterium]